MSWSDFFYMGGYAFYVWGSFGVTFILLAGEIISLRHRKRAAIMNAARARQGKVEQDHETTS